MAASGQRSGALAVRSRSRARDALNPLEPGFELFKRIGLAR